MRLAVLEKVEGEGQKDKVYLQREALWYFRFLDAGWNMPNKTRRMAQVPWMDRKAWQGPPAAIVP